jgi:polyol permease family
VTTIAPARSFWDRIGIPKALFFGYIGVLLFMIGDGVESNYLSPFLQETAHFSIPQVGLMFTLYGLVVFVSSWLAAALSDVWGPRRVMIVGFAFWIAFEIVFLVGGIGLHNDVIMIGAYTIRGLGYPLFAYSFLVWIAAVANRAKLATSIGWFYVCFTLGLPTLGALLANGAIPVLGEYGTLWLSLVVVAIGGLIALIGVRERRGRTALATDDTNPFATLFLGLQLLVTRPKVLSSAIIRMLNTAPMYGALIIFPGIFADKFGFGLSGWLILTTVTFSANIPFNVIFGFLGDKLGWRTTIRWFGAFGSGITLLGMYLVPMWTHSYPLAIVFGIAWGICLAGFVPLSALTAALEPKHTGAVMSAYNLGIGGSVFVGPLLVTIFYTLLGDTGTVVLFVALYLVAFALTFVFRRSDEQARRNAITAPEAAPLEAEPAR